VTTEHQRPRKPEGRIDLGFVRPFYSRAPASRAFPWPARVEGLLEAERRWWGSGIAEVFSATVALLEHAQLGTGAFRSVRQMPASGQIYRCDPASAALD